MSRELRDLLVKAAPAPEEEKAGLIRGGSRGQGERMGKTGQRMVGLSYLLGRRYDRASKYLASRKRGGALKDRAGPRLGKYH